MCAGEGQKTGVSLSAALTEQIAGCLNDYSLLLTADRPKQDRADVLEERARDAKLHDRCAAFLRSPDEIAALRDKTARETAEFFEIHGAADHAALVELSVNYDTLVTRYAVLSAMLAYVNDGGSSRGSYLIKGRPEIDTAHRNKVLRTCLSMDGGTMDASCTFEDVRPIPVTDNWFEEVYNNFGKPEMFR